MPVVKPYSAELKKKVLAAVKRGVPITRLAEKHGVTRASIYNWLAEKDMKADLRDTKAELAALKAENARLRARIAALEVV
jgi:transposase-like protein